LKQKLKNILIVIGTRPNFIKVTQFKKEAAKYANIDVKIAHTGQHFDKNMADVFFEQFKLLPDFYLNINTSQSPNKQIAQIMVELENLIENTYQPDLIITPGDVNSTVATALTANKLGIKLAHLESGLRSFDLEMPEEHNRLVTDQLSDICFITEKSGIENLKNEKKQAKQVFVGNTMIDTLVAFEDDIEKSKIIDKLNLLDKPFILTTIHRPSNVDNKEGISKLIEIIKSLPNYVFVFPIHPRTLKNIEKFNLNTEYESLKNLIVTKPLGYFEFQKLIKKCALVLTDSGGIQEETTFRKKPCLTLRENTERPITIEVGTNTLIPFSVNEIIEEVGNIENNTYKSGKIPELWDGKSTQRIMKYISENI
jgi:UDP-N-acetylglucosamine 2-epimerase (non-hydrolysing)